MVVFTCQHCNASLKKPSVEKHLIRCRKEAYLTCIDCLNDFYGEDYISHTSCVSEDQRYGDKNFKPKAVAVKQNNWINVVLECIKNNKNPKYITVFKRLANQSNIPRKKPKFINFLSHAMNMKNTDLAGEIFDLFQKKFEEANSKKDTDEKENSKSFNGSQLNHSSNEDSCNVEKNEANNISESDRDSPLIHVNKKKDKKSTKHKISKNYYNEEPLKAEVENENTSSEYTPNQKNKKKINKRETTIEDINIGKTEYDQDHTTTDSVGTIEKLSKKELKKLKKKKMYEAELKQIAETRADQEDVEETSEPVEKATSNKKKRKAHMSENELDENKKQKIEEFNQCEDPDNDSAMLDQPRKATFDWHEVILELLRKSDNCEMSLKRLTKKVLTQYQAVKGDRESYEQLMSKFNRKINKIPGVKILKDKARLINV